MRVEDVAGVIARASLGEASWRAVSDSLVRLVGARTTSMWLGDAGGGIEMIASSFDADTEQRYGTHYAHEDLWTQRGVSRLNRPLLGHELASADEWSRLAIWSDFYRPLGIGQLLAAGIPMGTGGGFCALGLHRAESERPFGEAEAAALGRLIPMLGTHLRLRQRLLRETGAAVVAMTGLDMMHQAAMALTGQGRVLHANALARAALRQHAGLRMRDGRLVPVDPRNELALAALLSRVAAGGAGGALRLRGGDPTRPVNVLVVRPPDAPAGDVVLLFILDGRPRRLTGKAPLLMQLFGLSGAEAQVAVLTAEGLTAAEIGEARGVAETTVRTQLRAVLGKTGAEGVRGLTGLVVGLPG